MTKVKVKKVEETIIEDSVKIKILEGGKMPTKAHIDDACYDLYVRKVDKYYTHTNKLRVVYHCGIKTQIPVGYEAVIRPRSSIRKYDMVMTNAPGTMDSGYTGEWSVTMIPLEPLNDGRLKKIIAGGIVIGAYNVGDKIAQFNIQKLTDIKLEETDSIEATERGDNGHGSSGK